MIEISAQGRTREAIQKAHDERGKMVARAWSWLFGGRK